MKHLESRRVKGKTSMMLWWWRWRRRLGLSSASVNVLCFFLIATVLVTAYLHGLIEVDSSRLVINIDGGGAGPRKAPRGQRYYRFDESENYLSESSLKLAHHVLLTQESAKMPKHEDTHGKRKPNKLVTIHESITSTKGDYLK